MMRFLQEPPPANAEPYQDIKIVRVNLGKCDPCAKVWIGNAKKPTYHYRFPSEERREAWIAIQKQNADERVARKAADKALKAEAIAEFVNPYKVGDILNSSWGYDQTNVEFFQVLEVGKRSLKIREICQDYKETGYMSGQSKPVPGKFVQNSEPKWVTIQIGVYGGKVSHSVPSPIHGHLSKCDAASEHYVSSYH
jgi:hypothetical protein